MNIYEPIIQRIPIENIEDDFDYYEIRVWRKHQLITTRQFGTLEESRKYYKEAHWDKEEREGRCYVEITKIKQLK